jgi:hypothetical protein
MQKKETKQSCGLCWTDLGRLALVDIVLCLLHFLPLASPSNALMIKAAIFPETSVNLS